MRRMNVWPVGPDRARDSTRTPRIPTLSYQPGKSILCDACVGIASEVADRRACARSCDLAAIRIELIMPTPVALP